jgi:hypothetical protein
MHFYLFTEAGFNVLNSLKTCEGTGGEDRISKCETGGEPEVL